MTATRIRPPFYSRRWRAFILGCCLLALIGVHVFILGYDKLADVDEGYALAIAERLHEGFKLYDGAVSQRGPLMYYGFEFMAAVTGWDNPMGLRFWALGFAVGHVLLVYWAGARLVSISTGIVAAILTVYALGFGMPLRDSVALHGETMQLPALLASVVVGALAMFSPQGSRERRWRLVIAGILLGAAICIKQSVALHPLPLLLWIVLSGHKNRATWRMILGEVTIFLVAVILLPAFFLIHAWAQGTLSELLYYCVTYNLTIHLHPSATSLRWLGTAFERLNERTLFFTTLVFLSGYAAPFVRRRVRAAWRARSGWALGRAFGSKTYLACHLVIALLTASSMSRFFPHYFIPALPFLTILVGACVQHPLVRVRSHLTAELVASAFACFLLVYGSLAAYFNEKIDGRVAHDALLDRLCRYISAATTPDQRIFVWGFSSWIYPYSHRRPAGRFVFETYVTGFVPWFWDDLEVEKARIVPGSVSALLSDLDRERPELVVDAGAVLFGRPMRAYDEPARWLHEHYCFELRFAAFDIYRRRPEGRACSVPYFPRSPAPVDYYGAALAIVMPRLVDEATSKWLPFGEYDKPSWFPGEHVPEGIEALRDLKKEREDREALAKLGVQNIRDLLPPPPCNDRKEDASAETSP